jgi:glycosyltransferase involved in cell wall biosynthesis
MILLSILICTLDSREPQFTKLISFIKKQIAENNLEDEVEIVHFSDKGYLPVGAKRNALMDNAEGIFVCFVDDDDWLSDTYIFDVINTIKSNSNIDCVGIKGMLIENGIEKKPFIHSIRFATYWEDDKAYYRPPNHISIIKKEIASKFKFPMINRGEDTDWATQIARSGLLKKEAFIDKILYYYNFDWNKTKTQKVT